MADSYNFSSATYRRKVRTQSVIRFIVCLIITIIALLPLYIVLINATRSNEEIIASGVSFIPGTNLIENIKNLTDPDYEIGRAHV